MTKEKGTMRRFMVGQPSIRHAALRARHLENCFENFEVSLRVTSRNAPEIGNTRKRCINPAQDGAATMRPLSPVRREEAFAA